VKIRDKETLEPPHVTIIRGFEAWRIDLRSGRFMDPRPDPADVPRALVDFIREVDNWQSLCDEWDRMYPSNPVFSGEQAEE
jgi:hypothetical protein